MIKMFFQRGQSVQLKENFIGLKNLEIHKTHPSLMQQKTQTRINEFFPSSRAYNYPNPVYEGTTNIRYYVDKHVHINIKIFDLAGDFVAELNDEAQGGMVNETVWNVGDIQSGVYLARIEAVCDCGNTEQAVIKIAVVK